MGDQPQAAAVALDQAEAGEAAARVDAQAEAGLRRGLAGLAEPPGGGPARRGSEGS